MWRNILHFPTNDRFCGINVIIMGVKRGSACIHLLRIRHVERTQFNPHRYSHSHIHTAKSVKFGFYFHLFFFFCFHIYLVNLYRHYSPFGCRGAGIILMHGYYVPSSVHANYTAHTHTEPSTRLSACAISSLPLCLSSLMLYLLLGNGNSAAQKKAFYYC